MIATVMTATAMTATAMKATTPMIMTAAVHQYMTGCGVQQQISKLINEMSNPMTKHLVNKMEQSQVALPHCLNYI
jgi:hypothetical protein